MALARRRSWLLGEGYVRRGWANWGHAGLRSRRSGPRMLEPGPSGIEGEKLCPSSAAYQGPRPVWARGCPGDTEPHRPASGAGPGGWQRRWDLVSSRSAGCASGGGPRTPPPPLAGRAGAGPLGPGAAAPARRAARSFWRPPKMTICHSIKVSGQLMGEPGSATSGQNGLLPRIGEVQMLNAEHCALSQSRPPPGRRSGRWTAAG